MSTLLLCPMRFVSDEVGPTMSSHKKSLLLASMDVNELRVRVESVTDGGLVKGVGGLV